MTNRDDESPAVLQPLHTEEFRAVPTSSGDDRARWTVAERGEAASKVLRVPEQAWVRSRLGTAAGLRALNAEHGHEFYKVPPEAEIEREAAAEVFDGGPVIDVQTHYIAERPETATLTEGPKMFLGLCAPDWWDGLSQPARYSLDEYYRCVFLESSTTVAVLTSAPGRGHHAMVTGEEMAATRELTERFGGTGRLLNHTVVHPNITAEIDQMDSWRRQFGTVAWKTYTLGALENGEWMVSEAWMLDDETVGIPFLERVREVGPRVVCAHKGMSLLAPAGSPRDVGPAAKAFPDIDFVIYHSAFEPPLGPGAYCEGPYSDEVADLGVNRLIKSLRESGLGHDSNVYAELGSTWFVLIKRPWEAAHVLGKLLLHLGEDNVVWGTDGIWFGPSQPLVDSFRAFEIPEALCEEFGYPQLTPAIKDKILFRNSARVYGLDIDQVLRLQADDNVDWARNAVREFQRTGVPTLA